MSFVLLGFDFFFSPTICLFLAEVGANVVKFMARLPADAADACAEAAHAALF
jgi:hypothetical protein